MSRRLILAAAVCAAALVGRELHAEACGVKLTIKAPRVNRTPDRSSNPSRILLLGDPPRALSKELTGRGHKVEVAGDADEARRVRYHAIIADEDRADQARTRWPGAVVVVRQGDSKSDADVVEQQLGAAPSRTLVARVPARTSQDERAPIRVGPDQGETPVASGGGTVVASGGGSSGAPATPPPPAAEPSDASDSSDDNSDATEAPARPAKRVAAVDTSAREREASEAPASKGPARLARRVFFPPSSAALTSRARARLTQTARWLQKHSDRSVTVEGHASTTGPAEPNQALSQVRADVVKQFLVEQGVDGSRIETVAYGLTRPEFEPGNSPRNRRVVIRLSE